MPLHPSELETSANDADELNASLLLNVVLAAALAQPQTLDVQTTHQVESIILTAMRDAQIPGVSVAIVRNNAVVFLHGYGYRDVATRARVDNNTIFRFGSVTKEFTATIAMALVEQHKLATDAMLSTWLPNLPHGDQIRLSDLLGQTSGYRDYYPLDYTDDEMAQPRSVDAIVNEYANFPLTMTPNTRWEYSNTNYTIAGTLIEKVSGESAAQLLQHYITGPAMLTNLFFDEPYRQLADRATGYNSYWTEPPHEETPEAPQWLNTAASLAGTALDLARFDIALMQHRLVSEASLREMTTARTLQNGKSTNYGYGLGTGTFDGHRIVSHGGNVIGFASSNRLAPDDETAVVVLTNCYQAPAGAIAQKIMALLLAPNATPAPPSSPRGKATGPEVALIRSWLEQLRNGTLPNRGMTADFRHLMNAKNRARARAALENLGPTTGVHLDDSHQRGGLDVFGGTVTFANGTRSVHVYRAPNGDVAEIFLTF
ncbi:MAG: serine hydrolase domain-containing protein [Candidatus Aquilonibacter sp.]